MWLTHSLENHQIILREALWSAVIFLFSFAGGAECHSVGAQSFFTQSKKTYIEILSIEGQVLTSNSGLVAVQSPAANLCWHLTCSLGLQK
jgi:hypothetical protein